MRWRLAQSFRRDKTAIAQPLNPFWRIESKP